MYRNTYQISQYVSFVEKVYRYTPIVQIYIPVLKITCVKEHTFSVPILEYFMYFGP